MWDIHMKRHTRSDIYKEGHTHGRHTIKEMPIKEHAHAGYIEGHTHEEEMRMEGTYTRKKLVST